MVKYNCYNLLVRSVHYKQQIILEEANMTRIRKKVTEIKRYSDIVYISLIIAAITAILGTFSVLLRQINYCPKFVIIIFMSAFIVSSISALIFFKLIEKNVENLVLTQRQIVLKDKNYKTFRDLNNIEDVIFIQDIILKLARNCQN